MPSRCPTLQLQLCVTTPHCLICICPLSIFPVQADDDGSGGGIASWVASTAALLFPRGHTRIELGQQRCADRKKIETESNRDRIVDRKIESKSIKPNRNITSMNTVMYLVLVLKHVISFLLVDSHQYLVMKCYRRYNGNDARFDVM